MEEGANEPLRNGDGGGGGGGALAAAPKRQSFKMRVQALSVEKPPSEKPWDFCMGLLALCCCIPAAGCGICLCTFALLINLLPIIEIVVGVMYYDQKYCPPEHIALLLIIGGSITLLAGIVETVGGGRKRKAAIELAKERQAEGGAGAPIVIPEVPLFMKILSGVLQLAAMIWLVTAAVFVYRLYSDVNYEDEADPHYCHPNLYKFAFWVVTLSLAILPLIFCCLCCAGAAALGAGAALDN